MKHKKQIYEKMKCRDFGESMSDETKLNVLNFVERQLRLYNVTHQRELLIEFWDWYCNHSDLNVDTKYTADEMVDEFLFN